MKMLMMIFKESLEEEIKALLAKHRVSAFTEMHEVTGMGEAGATLHSLAWPGFNNMVLAALPDPEAERLIAAMQEYRHVLERKQGDAKVPFRVFSLPCEMVV
jgi:hypothetical protein